MGTHGPGQSLAGGCLGGRGRGLKAGWSPQWLQCHWPWALPWREVQAHPPWQPRPPPATGLRSAAPGLLGGGTNYGLWLLEDSGPCRCTLAPPPPSPQFLLPSSVTPSPGGWLGGVTPALVSEDPILGLVLLHLTVHGHSGPTWITAVTAALAVGRQLYP